MTSEHTTLLSRKAVFDRDSNLIAYKLIAAATPSIESLTTTQVCSNVISNAFGEVGIDSIANNLPVFIQVTPALIKENACNVLPTDMILDLVEVDDADAELLSSLDELARVGYKLSLSQCANPSSLSSLIEKLTYLKIDIKAVDAKILNAQLVALGGFPGTLIAENIDSQELHELCLKLPFAGFEGEFLKKPKIIEGEALQGNQLVVLQLIEKLQNPDISPDELELTISQDATLAYKLLRIVNSAAYALRGEITSVKDAIIRIGLANVRNWAIMISFSGVENKPPQLISNIMARAKMCSLVSESLDVSDTSPFFTVGMFSLLDALMDQSMETILEKLPLADELKEGLLTHEGPYGHVLKNSIRYEQGLWDEMDTEPLSLDEYIDAYLDSISWADEVCGQLLGSTA